MTAAAVRLMLSERSDVVGADVHVISSLITVTHCQLAVGSVRHHRRCRSKGVRL